MLKSVIDKEVWPQTGQFELGLCYEPGDMGKLPGMEKSSQMHAWLKNALAQVKVDAAIKGILSVMLTCGSMLALDSVMPELEVQKLSTCTPEVWKQCRKQLKAKLKEKGSSATLDWLPEEAPRSAVLGKAAKA
ncbi:unnamed protein product, partial [Prorocentrum cordatum]